jgi:hypothetical protein
VVITTITVGIGGIIPAQDVVIGKTFQGIITLDRSDSKTGTTETDTTEMVVVGGMADISLIIKAAYLAG